MADMGFFPYHPSVPAAAVVAVVFCLMFIGMLALCVARRTTFFHCMLIGMAIELVGLFARVYATTHLDDMWSYLVWYLLVILAPSFMAASVHQTFGRLVWSATPLDKLNSRTLLVPPRFITPIFVMFDLAAFLVQLFGVSVVARAYTAGNDDPTKIDTDNLKTGSNILKVGLILQLVCLGLFALVGITFAIASRKWGTHVERRGSLLGSWHRLGWPINISATLLMVCTICRVFEFADPTNKSSIFNFEWAYWVLDTLTIIIAVGVFLIWHPGRYLPRENTGFFLNKGQLLRRRQAAEINNEKLDGAAVRAPHQRSLRDSYSRSSPVGLGINEVGMRAASRSPSPPGGRRTRPSLRVNTNTRPYLGQAVGRFPVNPSQLHDYGDLGSYQQTNPRDFV